MNQKREESLFKFKGLNGYRGHYARQQLSRFNHLQQATKQAKGKITLKGCSNCNPLVYILGKHLQINSFHNQSASNNMQEIYATFCWQFYQNNNRKYHFRRILTAVNTDVSSQRIKLSASVRFFQAFIIGQLSTISSILLDSSSKYFPPLSLVTALTESVKPAL